MPIDFQMKDENGNLIYDSNDYIHRSEDKEPINIGLGKWKEYQSA